MAKLKELEALGEPVLARAREAGARPGAAAALMQTANRMIQIASANDAKHAHIPQEDKEKVCPTPVHSQLYARMISVECSVPQCMIMMARGALAVSHPPATASNTFPGRQSGVQLLTLM